MHLYNKTSAHEEAATTLAGILALTGFHFLAALFVLLGHSSKAVTFEGTNAISEWLGPLTSCGMTMFFVLSGFLMWLDYGEAYRDYTRLGVLRAFAVPRL